MLTRKIKEALSRAHLVCSEKTISPEEMYGPEKERYEHFIKTELAKGVIEAAVTRHMTDECVQFYFDPDPRLDAYATAGAGIVVMNPGDFSKLRRLIKELYERLPPEADY